MELIKQTKVTEGRAKNESQTHVNNQDFLAPEATDALKNYRTRNQCS